MVADKETVLQSKQELEQLVKGLIWKSAIESPFDVVTVPVWKVRLWQWLGWQDSQEPFALLLQTNWKRDQVRWYQLAQQFSGSEEASMPTTIAFKCPCAGPLYSRYFLMSYGPKWLGIKTYSVEEENGN